MTQGAQDRTRLGVGGREWGGFGRAEDKLGKHSPAEPETDSGGGDNRRGDQRIIEE